MKSINSFEIRAISKSELAEMYNETMDPQYALVVFNRWLARSPGLLDALSATGYTKFQRVLTPKQVELIVSALGEP